MGPNGSWEKSHTCCLFLGRKGILLRLPKGTVTYLGKNLLDMASRRPGPKEGIFLGFQYPIEIPGVSMVNFMKTSCPMSIANIKALIRCLLPISSK